MSSSDLPTIPVRIALGMLLACLGRRADHLREMLHNNPRGSSPSKRDGREMNLRATTAGIAAVARLVKDAPSGDVAADVAALLCGWAMGHEDSRMQLLDVLREENPQVAERVRACRNAADAAILLLG